MLDQKIPARPRVALVFGDAVSVAYLRDAVASHVEIVYETAAADFDPSRLAGSRATAALVNLDGCEWLDSVEAQLQEAGVAVVFNDPEISNKLDGWAQARWLRHLTAKLSGNSDFDPPRPIAAQAQPVGAASGIEPTPEAAGALDAEAALVVLERPLSPAEIATMTADFGAVQEPAANTHPDETAPADATEKDMSTSDPHNEHADADALDVDTEALSAMIDARLAAAAGEPAPKSPEVWRVVDGDDVAAAENPPALPGSSAIEAAVGDDPDVLKALPSLDDWQLVDPEAPAAPAANPERDESAPPASSFDLGGLELVPLEIVAPVALNSEPIERWMHVDAHGKVAGANAKPGSKGEPA